MQRILVADDGSESALSAVELAADLAAKLDAELFALAVFDTAGFSGGILERFARSEGIDIAQAQEAMVQSATAYLDRCRDIATRHGVARFRAEHRAGSDPTLGIIEAALKHDIDLIVVGSRGYSRVPGLLLGRVSQKLASHAPCSVLIAR
jgi:nucleotide-binding universal stress UspA family protein